MNLLRVPFTRSNDGLFVPVRTAMIQAVNLMEAVFASGGRSFLESGPRVGLNRSASLRPGTNPELSGNTL